jgi:hypothetical protein
MATGQKVNQASKYARQKSSMDSFELSMLLSRRVSILFCREPQSAEPSAEPVYLSRIPASLRVPAKQTIKLVRPFY